ncbi:MAG: hypothetical protein R3B13_41110 [Polyangiaceae bacterium]
MSYCLRTPFTALCLLLAACGSEPPDGGEGSACGKSGPCAGVSADGNEDYDVDGLSVDGLNGGKADAVDRVEKAVQDATVDGELDDADVADLFDAAGERVSADEMNVIRVALGEDARFVVTDGAKQLGAELARVSGLPQSEAELVLSNASFGGTPVPPAVTELLARARLFGATAYDVREVDADGEQVWTHYPSISPSVGNMAWDYTEITPFALEADRDAADLQYLQIVGYDSVNGGKLPRYETRTGGTGNIAAHYDETYHPELFARGQSGQKWASNCAVLSDGSLHCLPAVRRDVLQRVILTNPALARGRHLLYHGHVSAKAGEITDVELSGIPSKLVAKGKVVTVDPLRLFAAWGFKLRAGISLRWGNTSSGTPYRDAWAGVVRTKRVLDGQCEATCARKATLGCPADLDESTCVGMCAHDAADAAVRKGCAGEYERLQECQSALTASQFACVDDHASPSGACASEGSELESCLAS